METAAELLARVAADITTRLDAIADPIQRAEAANAYLEAVPDLQKAIAAVTRAAVADLRTQGLSHADVAAKLGISRARAQQLAGSTKKADPA